MKITQRTINPFRACFVAIALPLAGTATAICAIAPAAQAQEEASSIAGVAVPKAAIRISDGSLQQGMGIAIAAGAKLFDLPERAGGPGKAEVYCWQGASYKEGRALFMQTLLNSALSQAGYTYQGVDAHTKNIPNLFDTQAYNSAALDMNPWDEQPAFFYGTSEKKGKTIVGVWLDQKSSKRVLLIIGEAGFAGAPAETKVPEITDSNIWLIKDFNDASKGMPFAPLPSFPQLSAKPHTVRGIVKDASGKPIAGAHLIAQVSAAGGFRTDHEAQTNAQGLYEILLPIGIGQVVNADCRVTYNGETLTLPLHPVDGTRDQFDAVRGHVENFVLRSRGTSGEGGGNYGGTVRLNTQHAPLGSTVEVTLTPTDTLLDGSKGKTLVFRYPIKSTFPETIVKGIPIGSYTLTAKLYDGDDALPLQARNTFTEQAGDEPAFSESLPVVFKSSGNERPTLGRSGVSRVEITLAP